MKKLIALSFVIAALATNASADVFNWTNGDADNSFASTGNWTPFLGDFIDGDSFYVDLAGPDKAVLSSTLGFLPADLYVGQTAGTAELEITGGTNVFSNRLRVGRGGSDATLTISGGSVTVPNSYTTFGDGGAAAITMTDGTLNVDRITLGQTGAFTSTMDLSGGTITLSPSDASPASTTGSLRLGSSTTAINLSGTAVLTMEALTMGNSSGTGLVTITGGELHLTGSTLFSFSGGALEDLPILSFGDLGGVDGLDLGGTIAMEGGLWTLAGDQTTLINDAIGLGYVTHSGLGTSLLPVFSAGVTTVTIVPIVVGLPGDGNDDGWVDGLDYLLWAGNFNAHPGADGDISDGDYNDDGWVDGLDYLLWAGNFGTHNANAVPEPGTFALAGLALMSLLVTGRRRK